MGRRQSAAVLRLLSGDARLNRLLQLKGFIDSAGIFRSGACRSGGRAPVGIFNKSKRNPKTWSAAKSDLKTKGISYNNCALLARLALRDMGILGEPELQRTRKALSISMAVATEALRDHLCLRHSEQPDCRGKAAPGRYLYVDI